MKPPKVEFHNLTCHRLAFSVSTAAVDDSTFGHIVVTIVELPAEAPTSEPEKRSL